MGDLKHHFVLVAEKEREYYYKLLYPMQDKILFALFSKYRDKLYLTGGTALSRFYFQHRFSDDLDLFSESLDFERAHRDIVNTIEKLGYEVDFADTTCSYIRLFVSDTYGTVLKIDFVRDKPIESPVERKGIYLDTLTSIAVNKITAFEDRAEAKDIIDLFYLVRKEGINIKRILTLAEQKRVPVPYEELLTINAVGISGKVLLTKPIDFTELEKFVEELKSSVSEYIKKNSQRQGRGPKK